MGIILWALQIYAFIVLVRALLSWFPNVDHSNPIIQFLHQATEPVLQPVRNALRNSFPQLQSVDLSPLVVLVIIQFIMYILSRL